MESGVKRLRGYGGPGDRGKKRGGAFRVEDTELEKFYLPFTRIFATFLLATARLD
jgi:hypothetical protein